MDLCLTAESSRGPSGSPTDQKGADPSLAQGNHSLRSMSWVKPGILPPCPGRSWADVQGQWGGGGSLGSLLVGVSGEGRPAGVECDAAVLQAGKCGAHSRESKSRSAGLPPISLRGEHEGCGRSAPVPLNLLPLFSN